MFKPFCGSSLYLAEFFQIKTGKPFLYGVCHIKSGIKDRELRNGSFWRYNNVELSVFLSFFVENCDLCLCAVSHKLLYL